MAKKDFLMGILGMVLVFGMAVVSCGDGGDTTNYDADGIWSVTIAGQSATIAITGNNWVFDASGTSYDDAGTFTRSGNVATMYSNAFNANIGTATLTSNTTMTLTLVSPSLLPGTYNATK